METGSGAERSARRLRGRSLRSLALALGLLAFVAAGGALVATLVGVTGPVTAWAQEQATPIQPSPVASEACPADLHGEGAEPWVRAELFFGTTSPDGTEYSEQEWRGFLDAEITPRFPDGLTVLTGHGQWRTDDGILQERSQVLIILYPAETAAESSTLLEEIRDEYEQQFQQSSVLRADITPVCTSF